MIRRYKQLLLAALLLLVLTLTYYNRFGSDYPARLLSRFSFAVTSSGTREIVYDNRTSPCQLPSRISFFTGYLSQHDSLNPAQRLCIKELDSHKPSLTCVEDGRLGNQMFCYAILFAIATYNHRSAHMSPTMSSFLSKYFQVSMDTLDQSVFNKTTWTDRQLLGTPPPDIRSLPNVTSSGTPSRIKFCCYPHIWKYFHELRTEILLELSFHPEIQNSTETLLAEAKHELYPETPVLVTLIGIHVRRGDYLTEQQRFGFEMPTVNFYWSAMAKLAALVPNPLFVFASNDIPWCEETFGVNNAGVSGNPSYRMYFVKGTSEENGGLDLAVLANCDHVIFGLGTFGWWAGYLNPGHVVYCSDCVTTKSVWMKKGRVHDGDYGNFVLPSWIGVPRNGSR